MGSNVESTALHAQDVVSTTIPVNENDNNNVTYGESTPTNKSNFLMVDTGAPVLNSVETDFEVPNFVFNIANLNKNCAEGKYIRSSLKEGELNYVATR